MGVIDGKLWLSDAVYSMILSRVFNRRLSNRIYFASLQLEQASASTRYIIDLRTCCMHYTQLTQAGFVKFRILGFSKEGIFQSVYLYRISQYQSLYPQSGMVQTSRQIYIGHSVVSSELLVALIGYLLYVTSACSTYFHC